MGWYNSDKNKTNLVMTPEFDCVFTANVVWMTHASDVRVKGLQSTLLYGRIKIGPTSELINVI